MKIFLGDTYGCPEGFDLEEDVDDTSVAEKWHDPQEKEKHSEEVGDQGISRGKLTPVGVNHSHDVGRNAVSHFHTCEMIKMIKNWSKVNIKIRKK